MIVHITRFVFMTAGALGGFLISRLIDWTEQIGYPQYFAVLIFLLLGTSIGYLLGGIFGREFETAFTSLERRLHDTSPGDLVAGTIGLLIGLVFAWLLGWPLRLIEPAWLAILSLVSLAVMFGYIGMRVTLVKSGELIDSLPFAQLPEAETPALCSGPKLLDTSAVIDGRLRALRKLRVIEGEVRVPRFVLSELHTLADSADEVRRSRGRRGLDSLATDSLAGENVAEVFEADYPEIPGVDGKLVRLAADTGGTIITVDHNLTSVARAEGVAVINLNEIATAMRPTYLPGERIHLDIVKEGKEPTQGVGYLEDGTMVVVAEGSTYVGRTVNVEVTSVLQTSAGRMVFARFVALAIDDAPRDPGDSNGG